MGIHDPFTDPVDNAAASLCMAMNGREGCSCCREKRGHSCDAMRQHLRYICHALGIDSDAIDKISNGGRISVRGGR